MNEPAEGQQPSANESLDIAFSCPHCQTHIVVDQSGAGVEIPCPRCSEKIVIPEAATNFDSRPTESTNVDASDRVLQKARIKACCKRLKNAKGEVIGLWVADPDDSNLTTLIADFQAAEGIPAGLFSAFKRGQYRTVLNHFDDNGGAFLMFGTALAPGESAWKGPKCILSIIGLVLISLAVYSQVVLAQDTSAWNSRLLAFCSIIGFVCWLTLWKMRRWTVSAFALSAALTQIALIAMDRWSPFVFIAASGLVATVFFYIPRYKLPMAPGGAVGHDTAIFRRFTVIFGAWLFATVFVIGGEFYSGYRQAKAIHSEPMRSVTEADYFPLREGDKALLDLANSKKDIKTVLHRVLGESVERGGYRYCRERTYMGESSVGMGYLLRIDKNGLYKLEEYTLDAREELVVAFPLRAGNSWPWKLVTSTPYGYLRIQESQMVGTQAIVGWENVTVGGMKYENCLRIHGTSEDLSRTFDAWYAPGIGMVKREEKSHGWRTGVITLSVFNPGRSTDAKTAQQDVDATEDPYFPLRLGQEITLVNPNHKNIETHVKIVGFAEKNGKSYVRSRKWWSLKSSEFADGFLETTELLRKDRNALYSVNEGLHSPEQVKFALPLKAGSTGQRSLGNSNESYTVIGPETVEIDGKVYEKCFHIRTTIAEGGKTRTVDSWEAPNVGTVKEIENDGKVSQTRILKEFTPSK